VLSSNIQDHQQESLWCS